MTQPSSERVVETVFVTLGQMQQPDHASLTLHERADRGLLLFAGDQISLPVPGLGTSSGRNGRW